MENGFKRASLAKQDELLIPKKKIHTQSQVRIISSYNSRWQEMRDALLHWKVLALDPVINKYVAPVPLVTYSQSKKLRDLLVQSHNNGTTFSKAFGSRGANGDVTHVEPLLHVLT